MYVGSKEQESVFPNSKADPNGVVYFLASDPLISSRDIKRSYITSAKFGMQAIAIEVTDSARVTLVHNADFYVHRNIVIVWDDQIVAAPTVLTPLGARLEILHDPNMLSKETFQEIVAYLDALTTPSLVE